MYYTKTKNITQIAEWLNVDIENILEELPETYDVVGVIGLMVGPGVRTICFRKDGELHREHGPAVMFSDGSQWWYKYGKWHRDDGPAMIQDDKQIWYKNGKLHCENGPAVIKNGDILWYKNGFLHRDDGPAAIHSYGLVEEWWRSGEKHREDGPAVLYSNGTEEYWVNGTRVDV